MDTVFLGLHVVMLTLNSHEPCTSWAKMHTGQLCAQPGFMENPLLRVRPYHYDNTSSRPIAEVKHT